MSDSHGVWAAGERNLQDLKELRSLSSNHSKLFDLAANFYTQMQGSDFEKAWRYAGAHLWVHGKRCSEEQAQKFVESKDDKYWGTVYRIVWSDIQDTIAGEDSGPEGED